VRGVGRAVAVGTRTRRRRAVGDRAIVIGVQRAVVADIAQLTTDKAMPRLVRTKIYVTLSNLSPYGNLVYRSSWRQLLHL
jgi:hypothetical protein